MNSFTCVRRSGRWVSKISHPIVCAVISFDHEVTMLRAGQLLGFPRCRCFVLTPTPPRGAA